MGRSKKVEDARERAPEWALPMRMRTSEADEEIRRSSPAEPSAPMVVGAPPVRVGHRQAIQRVPMRCSFFCLKVLAFDREVEK